MDSRNLEEQRLGGMGQCAKAVLKVLRKVVKNQTKKSHLNFHYFFKHLNFHAKIHELYNFDKKIRFQFLNFYGDFFVYFYENIVK